MATVIVPAVAYNDRAVTARYFGTGNGVRTIWNLACMDSDRALLHPVLYRKDWQMPGHYRLYSTSRENQFLRSQELDNAAWSKNAGVVVSGTYPAPNGTNTAQFVAEGTAIQAHYVSQVDATFGTPRTVSVYAKAGTRTWLGIHLGGNSTYFNLGSGVLGTIAGGFTASISSVGNGWYRCVISGTGSNSNCFFFPTTGDTTASHDGDGASGLYLWGAQRETGSSATSYIQTTTAAASVTDYSTDANGKVTFAAAPVLGADVAYLDPWMGTACYKSFGTGDGSATMFSLPWKPVAPSIYIDGVLQTLTTHYTVTPGGVITFVSPPGNGTVLTWTGNFGPQR